MSNRDITNPKENIILFDIIGLLPMTTRALYKMVLQHRYKSEWFFNFIWNWKNLQNPLWDLEKILYWIICYPYWPCKNTKSFCKKFRITLSYPKCKLNKFLFDYFVYPGSRGPVCTYKKWIITTSRKFKRGSMYNKLLGDSVGGYKKQSNWPCSPSSVGRSQGAWQGQGLKPHGGYFCGIKAIKKNKTVFS